MEQKEIEDVFNHPEKLVHMPIPYDDLVDCIIGRDVRESHEETAVIWLSWLDEWRSAGYQEQQCVDMFFAIVLSQLAEYKSSEMMTDIAEYLQELE
jgi:hypothetical protein